jgi:hypothetical protein
VGLGVATVLKISPVLLLVYLVLRGRRQVLGPAIATAVGWMALAAALGRPVDLLVWTRDVAPRVAKGTINVYNQSLVGWISRLLTHHTDLAVNGAPGAANVFAYVFALAALFVLWWARRRRPFEALELGVLVLVAVLAGPLSWDHYATWALIPLVLVLDVTRWQRLRRVQTAMLTASIAVSLVFLHGAIPIPSPTSVAADWSLRIGTGPYTLALLIWLGIASWLLAQPAAVATDPPDSAEPRSSPVAPVAVGEPV